MKIDVFSANGSKKSTMDLPESIFGARINQGLMHQAVVMQQSNRRTVIAVAKSRGQVQGSSRKLYGQKHTGRARRGSVRSPLLRGGGKAFGPKSNANFIKDMPKGMRKAAIISCLSLQAKKGGILGLDTYPATIKTKELVTMLTKMPVEYGRHIVIVTAGRHQGLELSARNMHRVKTLDVAYLNAEDLLRAKHVIFLTDAITKAEEMLTKDKNHQAGKSHSPVEEKVQAPRKSKTKTAGKKATKKAKAKAAASKHSKK
jgi:large subunit ribosomal protein L4